ncbi:hypothetical protein QO058_12110 [Bosea vestrisii]|uniref:hypothetical protein n=1 Tax=Bosea vestrisii TaxID=151416 RepID=UPI0024E013D1|nr:hypothetical protein [Bosea vestrisii]WID98918.1 hypothetical protein QO058_12110 [Bosea vestrisii]
MLLMIYTLIVCFAIQYQFLPADFDEATREPTEHFKAEVEKRLAEEASRSAPTSGV